MSIVKSEIFVSYRRWDSRTVYLSYGFSKSPPAFYFFRDWLNMNPLNVNRIFSSQRRQMFVCCSECCPNVRMKKTECSKSWRWVVLHFNKKVWQKVCNVVNRDVIWKFHHRYFMKDNYFGKTHLCGFRCWDYAVFHAFRSKSDAFDLIRLSSRIF